VRRAALLAWLVGGAALAGCAHTDPNVGKRGIWLDCDLPGANVYVDDVYLQHALRWRSQPMPLHPGFHRVEVTADGYYPFYAEVTVGDAGFQKLEVRLRREVPND
jgi:PEGA domain